MSSHMALNIAKVKQAIGVAQHSVDAELDQATEALKTMEINVKLLEAKLHAVGAASAALSQARTELMEELVGLSGYDLDSSTNPNAVLFSKFAKTFQTLDADRAQQVGVLYQAAVIGCSQDWLRRIEDVKTQLKAHVEEQVRFDHYKAKVQELRNEDKNMTMRGRTPSAAAREKLARNELKLEAAKGGFEKSRSTIISLLRGTFDSRGHDSEKVMLRFMQYNLKWSGEYRDLMTSLSPAVEELVASILNHELAHAPKADDASPTPSAPAATPSGWAPAAGNDAAASAAAAGFGATASSFAGDAGFDFPPAAAPAPAKVVAAVPAPVPAPVAVAPPSPQMAPAAAPVTTFEEDASALSQFKGMSLGSAAPAGRKAGRASVTAKPVASAPAAPGATSWDWGAPQPTPSQTPSSVNVASANDWGFAGAAATPAAAPAAASWGSFGATAAAPAPAAPAADWGSFGATAPAPAPAAPAADWGSFGATAPAQAPAAPAADWGSFGATAPAPTPAAPAAEWGSFGATAPAPAATPEWGFTAANPTVAAAPQSVAPPSPPTVPASSGWGFGAQPTAPAPATSSRGGAEWGFGATPAAPAASSNSSRGGSSWGAPAAPASSSRGGSSWGAPAAPIAAQPAQPTQVPAAPAPARGAQDWGYVPAVHPTVGFAGGNALPATSTASAAGFGFAAPAPRASFSAPAQPPAKPANPFDDF